jgi:predicted molibdopterin-dependent oxidoreductase YjgC
MSNSKLTIYLDGKELEASAGQTVAEALLAHGITVFGTNHKGYPRGPFCLMGLCGQCLVQIEDQINVKACGCRIVPEMNIYRQHDNKITSRDDES